MTTITFFKDQSGGYQGFDCLGHAGYAEAGEDIVCAGISALVINTINSLECFTAEQIRTTADQESGAIHLSFDSPAGHDGQLLLQSLVLGLQGIQTTYGEKYLQLNFREV